MTHSALYSGWVRHRRSSPVVNEFTYRVSMFYLDLEELPALVKREPLWSLHRSNLARFRRADYLGDPRMPLADAVRSLVRTRTGGLVQGPIRMLTQVRTFGYVFNPVTFYFCFDASGERVDFIVAEITNTPWKERHAYVLPRPSSRSGTQRWRFPKAFHVSPFLPMDLEHDWRFSDPGRRLTVHMQDRRDGAVVLDATLALDRKPLGRHTLSLAVLRHPLATLKVTAGIYFQALRLWWKRCPFHPHPRRATARERSVSHAPHHTPEQVQQDDRLHGPHGREAESAARRLAPADRAQAGARASRRPAGRGALHP